MRKPTEVIVLRQEEKRITCNCEECKTSGKPATFVVIEGHLEK